MNQGQQILLGFWDERSRVCQSSKDGVTLQSHPGYAWGRAGVRWGFWFFEGFLVTFSDKAMEMYSRIKVSTLNNVDGAVARD